MPCDARPRAEQSQNADFVGRGAELTALDEALSRAAAGEPRALVVGGEAGVGKTRLLTEFLGRAAADGVVVALGGCVEPGADALPYHPVSTALRALRRQLGAEAWTEAVAAAECLEPPLLLATARLRLAEALIVRGGPDARDTARDLLRRAAATAHDLGAPPSRRTSPPWPPAPGSRSTRTRRPPIRPRRRPWA